MISLETFIRTNIKKYNITSFEFELILAYILKKSREHILTRPELDLTAREENRALSLIRRRDQGEPLAYLTGHKEFYGIEFAVNKHVLIPRPETELMVENGLEILKRYDEGVIIDVGTGSGCIVISLISNQFSNYQYSKNYNFIGTDISKQALSVARKNAKIHKIEKLIKFYQGNLLDPILNHKKFLLLNSYFLILANLPYLTPSQIKNSPSIKYEPRLALSAGRDGLKYYRELFRQIRNLYRSAPIRSLSVLCEIDPSQRLSIKKLAKQHLPESTFQIKKDLGGHSRLVIISLN